MTTTATEMKNAATQSLVKQDANQNGKKKVSLSQAIELQKAGFALALPKDFDADRFTRLAITAIKNNGKLMQCEPASILGGLMLCAQLGLEPNSPLHEASLIPFNKKATFQIEYRGLLKLVWNSGMVSNVDYGVIYSKDVYKYVKGFTPVFEHIPSVEADRGEPIAYYAIANIIGGGNAISFWTLDDVKKHAARYSKAYGDSYKDSPWQTAFDSMAIKTVLKELCDKKLPKRTTNEALKFAKALSKDEHINQVDEETLLKAQARRLELDEIETEDAKFEEDSGQNKQQPEEDYTNPTFVLERIGNIKSLPEFNNWHKKHQKDISMIAGKDGELIEKAMKDKQAELTKK